MNKYFQVLYEDNHLIIVNKAAGLLVQEDASGEATLGDYVREYLKEKYNKPGKVFLGITHRLDRPVSGAVILTRTSKALERMSKIFRERDIQKTYWAVVKNKPAEKQAKLTNWLVKNDPENKVAVYDYPVDDSQKAELSYKVLGYMNNHWLLEVNLITGRKHQIRAQLAHINCPIRGDVKYGFAKANPDKSINLHSRRIYFVHPIKKEPLIIVAGLPENQFWEQFLELDERNLKDKDLDHLY